MNSQKNERFLCVLQCLVCGFDTFFDKVVKNNCLLFGG